MLALAVVAGCKAKDALVPQDWALAVQTAESRDAHQRLADHYNEVAQNLLAQAEEERRILINYLSAPHKYGKRIQDLKSHAQAEIRGLELAARESQQLAEYHRQLAQGLP
jgi:hypothetical protein